jgi:hypothetical protein
MHTALHAISRLARDCTDDALRRRVVREVDMSCKDIGDGLKRIANLSSLGNDSPSVGSTGLRVKISRQWYKLEWRFLKRGEVQELQAKFKASTQRLTALLAILNQCVCAFRSNENDSDDHAVSNATSSLRAHFSNHFRGLAEKNDVFSRAIGNNTTLLTNSFMQLHGEHSALRREVAALRDLASNAGFKWGNLDGKTAAVIILFLAICSADVMHRSFHTALLLAALCVLLRFSSRQSNSLAPPVGWSELNCVVLIDALDRRLLLPLDLCASYEVTFSDISP